MKHKLELQQAGSGDHFNGRCTCGGWTVYPGSWHDSKKNVKKLFQHHVENMRAATLHHEVCGAYEIDEELNLTYGTNR